MSSGTFIIVLLLVVLSFLNQFPQSDFLSWRDFLKIFQSWRESHDCFQRCKLAVIELTIPSIHWNFSSWCLLHSLVICQPAKVVPHSLQEILVIHMVFITGPAEPELHKVMIKWMILRFVQPIAQCWTDCCCGQGVCAPSNLFCPRTWRRFVICYSSCGLGLQILEQDSSSFLSGPSVSTSIAQPLSTSAHDAVVAHGLDTELPTSKEHALPKKFWNFLEFVCFCFFFFFQNAEMHA